MATAVQRDRALDLLCEAVNVMRGTGVEGIYELLFDVTDIVQSRIIAENLKVRRGLNMSRLDIWKLPNDSYLKGKVEPPNLETILLRLRFMAEKVSNLDVIIDLITGALHYLAMPEDGINKAKNGSESEICQTDLASDELTQASAELEAGVTASDPRLESHDEAADVYKDIVAYLDSPMDSDTLHNTTSRNSMLPKGREDLVLMGSKADHIIRPLNQILVSPEMNSVLSLSDEAVWFTKLVNSDESVNNLAVPDRLQLFAVLQVIMKVLKMTMELVESQMKYRTHFGKHVEKLQQHIACAESGCISEVMSKIRTCLKKAEYRSLFLHFQHVKLLALHFLIQFGLLIKTLENMPEISDDVLSRLITQLNILVFFSLQTDKDALFSFMLGNINRSGCVEAETSVVQNV